MSDRPVESARPSSARIAETLGAAKRGARALAWRLLRAVPVLGASSRIYAGVASVAERRDALRQAVQSMLPQVDRMFVYLNGYPDVPDYLAHRKIEVFRSQEHGMRGAGGKFYGLTRLKTGLYFTFDDDIIYPKNYVAKMRSDLRECRCRAVVGVHGTYYPSRPRSYFDRTLCHYREQNRTRSPMSLLGTGTVAFPIPLVPIGPDHFKSEDRADLWFGVFLKERSIPAVVVERRTGWLTDIDHRTLSLFDHAFANSRPHSRIVFEAQSWGVEDLVARTAGLDEAISPAWNAFVAFYRDLRGPGPAVAARHLLKQDRVRGLLDLVGRYCSPDEMFPVWSALADYGAEGAGAFEALTQDCAFYDPSEAAGLLRRAFEAAEARGDAERAEIFARRALGLYRKGGMLQEAKTFIDALAAKGPLSPGLVRDDILVGLARHDYRDVLRKFETYDPELVQADWFQHRKGIAALHVHGMDAALPIFRQTFGAGSGPRITAIGVHCQTNRIVRPSSEPASMLVALAEDFLREGRDCEPLIKLHIGLGERKTGADLFRRAEPALRRKPDQAAIAALWAACQADAGSALAALNQVFAQHGMSLLQRRGSSPDALGDLSGAPSAKVASGPLISVVLAAGRGEASVEYALRSVAEQTHRHLEIIVVDGSGTPSTRLLLEGFAAADPRIRIMDAPTGGAGAGRNLGIAAVTGDFVAFQDARTFAHPERIEMQLGDFAADSATMASLGRSVRLTPEGLVALDQTGAMLVADGAALMCRAEVIGDLGGFAGDGAAGDLEYRDRIVACYGSHVVSSMPHVLLLTPVLYRTGVAGPRETAEAERREAEFTSAYVKRHLLARGRREDLFVPL
jgi:glycosyltransferase involved in cell wall biosynthesis